jgi:hypothetical protein
MRRNIAMGKAELALSDHYDVRLRGDRNATLPTP